MSIVYVLASNRIEHGVNGRYVEVVGWVGWVLFLLRRAANSAC